MRHWRNLSPDVGAIYCLDLILFLLLRLPLSPATYLSFTISLIKDQNIFEEQNRGPASEPAGSILS